MIEPHVILVDDDRSLRESAKRALRREPYRIIAVASARECIDMLLAAPIQVVVCDQHMPEIQGLDLLSYLKKSRPEIVRIVLSGNITLDSALDAVNDCEVFRLLAKPCAAAELALAIRAGLRQHHLITQGRRLLEMLHKQVALVRNSIGDVSQSTSISTLVARDRNLEQLIMDATHEAEQLEVFIKEKIN